MGRRGWTIDKREKKIVGIFLSSMLILTAAVPLVLTLMFASAPTASAWTLGWSCFSASPWATNTRGLVYIGLLHVALPEKLGGRIPW